MILDEVLIDCLGEGEGLDVYGARFRKALLDGVPVSFDGGQYFITSYSMTPAGANVYRLEVVGRQTMRSLRRKR